ncbi:MAG: B12-binding domain-containing protein [Betaproteobacteria bacterium]
MSDILQRLSLCVEAGKANAKSAYPPQLKGQPGADELCQEALAAGVRPTDVLEQALVPAMARIGEKFSRGEAFVPEMLLAARAMTAAMAHLRPYFASGEVKRRGVFVIGTVAGDLHDIGKNIVAMVVEGGGWEVVDLGVDVKTEKVLEAVARHPGCVVGLSALLTTTMVNMEKTVREIKARHPGTLVLVGGAPVTREFCEKIGASHYSPDPQGAVEYLKSLVVAA